ncbi:L-serine ammonia-lyase [Cryobacterium sp. BB307]|uniref:L-serine ammonia-lyase n=1 Tax=Cryobacterium sp. BB307 TaxID=2716317 RepID=UPI001447D54D|nr:L-serine ammonia-lyase [Cryobacterium sp. BB307]
MTISVFDLFKVGIGPSSSHTVGPMRAAERFVREVAERMPLERITEIGVDLYGSLAATGAGHGTLNAVLLGLEGRRPDTIEVAEMEQRLAEMRENPTVRLGGVKELPFGERDIVLHLQESLDFHPNGMRLTAFAGDLGRQHSETFYSVGGGFIVNEDEAQRAVPASSTHWPLPFSSGAELLELAREHGSFSAVMLKNEAALRTEDDVRAGLLHIRNVMVECQERGMRRDGTLPGGLGVPRRAHDWHQQLERDDPHRKPEFAQDWVNLVALAVNEENASGGRVVTAPTNGAAGIIPAVLHYAMHYTDAGARDRDDAAVRFLLTAGAIGSLYKERASISGAEVGCQGEVGSAASMAAGALAEVLGGTPAQVENAAEIAMEHSLGLTCDPIGGLVQIPCIERNAISAGKAINAARMALRGDGTHRVTLDEVIETMRVTGRDMMSIYKETSRGGLAVHVSVNNIEC